MQSILAEQQRKDWERIKFRQEEYERKRQELHERYQNEEREQHEREERLQTIADRVRPHIQADYARILQPTQVILFILINIFKSILGIQCSSWIITEY
jgi:bisphosphoglycerate-dependent phosphoglycerate mutase